MVIEGAKQYYQSYNVIPAFAHEIKYMNRIAKKVLNAEYGAEEFGAEQTLYWSHKRNKECSYCGHGKNHKAALLSDDGKLFGCYKCNSYPNEEEMVTDYEAEEFEAQRGMKS